VIGRNRITATFLPLGEHGDRFSGQSADTGGGGHGDGVHGHALGVGGCDTRILHSIYRLVNRFS